MKSQRQAPGKRRGGPPRSGSSRGGPAMPLVDEQDLLDQQGPGYSMSDMREAMAAQRTGAGKGQPERDVAVSQPDGSDMQAAQQMHMVPGDLQVDKSGALQLHFDESEDLLVSIRRGIHDLERNNGGQRGGTSDGGNIRVLLYSPQTGAVERKAGGGGLGSAGSARGSVQRKVTRFSRRLEEALVLLGRSGVAPDTLRIFMASEWFRDEHGNAWSAEEQHLAMDLLSDATASYMNILVVNGSLRWAASDMLGDEADEPKPR